RRADVPGVNPGRVDPLEHRYGVVTPTHEVQRLGETFQILDVQPTGCIDPGEGLDRLDPSPIAVGPLRPLELRTDVHHNAPKPLVPVGPARCPPRVRTA